MHSPPDSTDPCPCKGHGWKTGTVKVISKKHGTVVKHKVTYLQHDSEIYFTLKKRALVGLPPTRKKK